MHQLSGFNKKIMTSQIKQHCWKGMCVGGKGVTEADKGSAWKLLIMKRWWSSPRIDFRLLWLLSVLHLLVPAKYTPELNRVLLTLHLC